MSDRYNLRSGAGDGKENNAAPILSGGKKISAKKKRASAKKK